MIPIIPHATVTMFGALDPEGEIYEKCRLTFIGNPADVVLYHWVPVYERWQRVDRLTQAQVLSNGRQHTITGISDALVYEVGVDPSEAKVRWEITEKGCSSCG